MQKTSYLVTTNTVSGGFGALTGNQQIVTTPVITRYVGELYEQTGSVGTAFIFLGSQRVAAVDTNNTSPLYYHTDHLGSTNVISDNNGSVSELIEYDPYGKISRHDGSLANVNRLVKQQFTGKQLDDETGLIYFGARYYDPSLGRFITPDTIVQAPSNPQTLNRYSYCGNNPINRIDPTGHKWSWGKFFKSFVSTFVQIVTTVVLTPFIGPIAAGFVGGFLGGALNAGLNGASFGQAMMSGLVGGGIGALGGAAFGSTGVNGFLGSAGPAVGIGLLAVGGIYSAVTGNLDSFAGGLLGGIGGYAAGQGILNSGALKNNPSVKSYKQAQIQAQKNNQSLKTDQKPRAIKVYRKGETGDVLDGAMYDGKYYPAKTAQGGEPAFRVFGGKSGRLGDSWTPLDPRTTTDFTNIMGLPPENTSGAMVGGRLSPGARYVELPASPIGTNQGGGVEWVLDNAARDINTEFIGRWNFKN